MFKWREDTKTCFKNKQGVEMSILEVVNALYNKDNIKVLPRGHGGNIGVIKRNGCYYNRGEQLISINQLLFSLLAFDQGNYRIEDLEPIKKSINGNGIAFEYWETEDNYCIKFTEYPDELRSIGAVWRLGEIHGVPIYISCSPDYNNSPYDKTKVVYLPGEDKSRDNETIKIPKSKILQFDTFCQELHNLLTEKLEEKRDKCGIKSKVKNIERELKEVKELLNG